MSHWKHECHVGGWFSMVEAEVNSRCNRRCPYCPNAVLAHDASLPELMPDDVFARLLSELSRVGYGGRLSFHFYGEPLLHPDLAELLRRVTARLPQVRQVLYTNGDLLTDALYSELRESGVSRFIVTSHDSKPVPDRLDQVVLFPSDLNLTNRGGAVEIADLPPVQFPLKIRCFAASSVLIITVTGDVLLCYEDARRTECMGNIMEEHIDAIWFGPRFQRIRRQLAEGDRTVVPVCAKCNNVSHPNAETYDFRP